MIRLVIERLIVSLEGLETCLATPDPPNSSK